VLGRTGGRRVCYPTWPSCSERGRTSPPAHQLRSGLVKVVNLRRRW